MQKIEITTCTLHERDKVENYCKEFIKVKRIDLVTLEVTTPNLSFKDITNFLEENKISWKLTNA